MQPRNKKVQGFLMVLTSSTLWGISGTVAQYLFHQKGFAPGWLVMIRLTLSGFALLLFSYIRGDKKNVWAIWYHRKDRRQLLILGILGMLGVQYTYFAAIEAGNAATATLLQYLGPVFITIYLALRLWRIPRLGELAAVGLALTGTFLLVSDGTFSNLSISGWAVFWGLTSAVALAFYTLYPIKLLQTWSSAIVVGWAMIIGGIGICFIYPPWNTQGQEWSFPIFLFVSIIVIFGTLVPFYLYLDSLRYISPTETSILASAEPLSATVIAILWLKIPFGFSEVLGGFLILLTVVLLSLQKEATAKEKGLSTREAKG